jgi:hypothetical protein
VRGVSQSGDEPTGRTAGANFGRGGEGATLADTTRELLNGGGEAGSPRGHEPSDGGEDVANAACERAQGVRAAGEQQPSTLAGEALPSRPCAGDGAGHWAVEPPVGRLANGIPNRVDRLRAAGNAVVPQLPELIGRTILAYEQQLGLAA